MFTYNGNGNDFFSASVLHGIFKCALQFDSGVGSDVNHVFQGLEKTIKNYFIRIQMVDRSFDSSKKCYFTSFSAFHLISYFVYIT